MSLRRRDLLSLPAVALRAAAPAFYTTAQRNGRWWLRTPSGELEFSLGLNHIDPAGLRFTENGAIWRERYGGSMKRWLETSVRPSLRKWGFNCAGWTQEVVVRGATIHRHSRPFTADEYRWLGMPYCHLLRFTEMHQWEAETKHPDFFAPEFAEWCDHVAREDCASLAADPNLIGYFYVDCPTWVHTRQWNTWKGPIFDPAKLETESGRKELHRIATQYYRVTRDAVRRYDKNHLIFGDRYEAAAPLPVEVVDAALPFVDALTFQHFAPVPAITANLAKWHERTGKPVMVIDTAKNVPIGGGRMHHDAKFYSELLRACRELPGTIGVHLCGAFTENRSRKRGLLDEKEDPTPALSEIVKANHEMTAWATSAAAIK